MLKRIKSSIICLYYLHSIRKAKLKAILLSYTGRSVLMHYRMALHWRRKWQPTPLFLPGESQGRESLVAAVYVSSSPTNLFPQYTCRLKWFSTVIKSSEALIFIVNPALPSYHLKFRPEIDTSFFLNRVYVSHSMKICPTMCFLSQLSPPKCWIAATIKNKVYFGSLGHRNQSRKRNKRNPNWKRRSKTLTVCRWHDPRNQQILFIFHQLFLQYVYWCSLCNFIACGFM